MQSIRRRSASSTALVNLGVRNSVTTPCAIGHAHLGNLLPRLVGGEVFDLVADVHVPVDAADRAVGGIAAAHFQQHADGERRVGFVAEEVIEGAFEVADEFLGPVAFLAGFLGRAQVLDRRRDGARVFVSQRGIDLVGAGQLGADKPIGAFADMAFGAGDPGVGPVADRSRTPAS